MASKNKNNSTVYQVLLDCQRVGIPIDFDKITDEQIEQADAIFRYHQYPDRKLTFIKKAAALYSAAFDLPLTEGYIFAILEALMSTHNCIQISMATLATLANVSKPAVSNSIKDLKQKGFIAEVYPSAKSSPAMYMINPKEATKGKVYSTLQHDFDLFAGEATEMHDWLCEQSKFKGLVIQDNLKLKDQDRVQKYREAVADHKRKEVAWPEITYTSVSSK